MSDPVAAADGDRPTTGGAIAPAVQAGQMLRAAREAAGMHLAAVASTIKVPVSRLEALEAGRLDELHDAVFTRALTGSVCRVLRMDPAPVLALLPRGSVPALAEDAQAINTPFHTPGQDVRPSWRDVLTRPGALVVAALLVGAVVLLLLPEFSRRPPVNPSTASVATPATSPAPTAVPQAGGPAPTGTQADSAPAGSGGAAPLAVAPAAAPVAPEAHSAGRAGEPAAAVAPVPARAGPVAVIDLTVRGTSWVEVIDGAGTTLLRRNVEAGERVALDGPVPLRVAIGRAAEVAVLVRGKAFDLAPFTTRDNVARFEVR